MRPSVVRAAAREYRSVIARARPLASRLRPGQPSQATCNHLRVLTVRHASSDVTFRGPWPDQELKEQGLAEYMFSNFDKYGSSTAIVDDATGTTYTYSELQPLVRKIGSFMARQGFRKGDVICYFGTNNAEFPLLLLACAATGVTLTTANPAYTTDELKRHMEHSGAKAIVTVPPLVPRVKEVGIRINNITVIGSAEGCRPFSTLLDDDGGAFPEGVAINPREDLVMLPYSSGTTGLPKGVMLSHYNVVSNLIQLRTALATSPEDNNFAVLPFYHIYGLSAVLLGTLQDGGTLVTTPGFEPGSFLKAIQSRKITQLHIVPPIVLFLTRHPVVDKFDLSSLRHVISAAAPLGGALSQEFSEKRKIKLLQGYGLTETSPVAALDTVSVTVGSIGFPLPNTEFKVVNPETGASLGKNETGEICIRGPQVMKGYLNNQKATDDMIDSDGWLHSGDIGHATDKGKFVITDRLKELIKYKGLQVAPAELEDLLFNHPAVQDAAVIGIPDDRAGELPKAYVVCKPNTNVSAEDIQEFVASNVSEYKQLRGGVEFLTEIPKSPSGKILRRILRDKN